MLTLSTLTVDHWDLVSVGPGPHPTSEPTVYRAKTRCRVGDEVFLWPG
jgi:hypothetical protein